MTKPWTIEDIYNDVCLSIWGCVPIDIDWVSETNLFKAEIEERLIAKTK